MPRRVMALGGRESTVEIPRHIAGGVRGSLAGLAGRGQYRQGNQGSRLAPDGEKSWRTGEYPASHRCLAGHGHLLASAFYGRLASRCSIAGGRWWVKSAPVIRLRSASRV